MSSKAQCPLAAATVGSNDGFFAEPGAPPLFYPLPSQAYADSKATLLHLFEFTFPFASPYPLLQCYCEASKEIFSLSYLLHIHSTSNASLLQHYQPIFSLYLPQLVVIGLLRSTSVRSYKTNYVKPYIILMFDDNVITLILQKQNILLVQIYHKTHPYVLGQSLS